MSKSLLLLGLGLVIAAVPARSQGLSGKAVLSAQREPAGMVMAGTAGVASLTLEEAWRLAEEANRDLRRARANVAGADGQLKDTQAPIWNNPVLSTEHTRRRVTPTVPSDDRFSEWNLGLSQTFEVAGQQGHRRQAAQLDLDASREDVEEVRREIRAAVEQRFTRVLELQRRLELERDGLKLIQEAAAAVGKRVRAGEDSRLDGNLAAVEAERAQNQLSLLSEQLREARAELAALLQLPPASFPEVSGELNVSSRNYSLDELLSRAATQPRVRSLTLREEAAHSKLALERASVYPDVTVGLTTGREGPADGRERLTMLSVSMPLPLFKRNAAGIGKATSELTQAQIERGATIRDVEAQVRALWQKLESVRARLKRLTESVLPTLDENQRLSTVAFRAGEIGLLQLVVVNRQLIDARRDHLEALAELVQTRIELEKAAGWPTESR